MKTVFAVYNCHVLHCSVSESVEIQQLLLYLLYYTYYSTDTSLIFCQTGTIDCVLEIL